MKKQRFKPRVGWAIDKTILGGGWLAAKIKPTRATHRVKIIDARDLTAEHAVSTILNTIYKQNGHTQWGYIQELAEKVGMQIKVKAKGVKAKVKQ